MNGFSTNGFTQSLNGILTISDGLGTTIQEGQIVTGDITGQDITSDSVTTSSLTTTSLELTGDLTVDNNFAVNGITDFANTTDTSSLIDTVYSVKVEGGLIVKKNTYATDMMTNNLVTGDIGCGSLNSSNGVNCVSLKSTDISCKSMVADDVFYKTKICGWINLGVAPYLHIPLTTSLQDTSTGIANFNISTYLTNANNNSLFLLPYYSVVFYNGNNILFVANNSEGVTMYYSTIVFNQDAVCTKILIQYKNRVLL